MKPQYGVWRPVRGRLVLKMPYSKDNRSWLKAVLGKSIRPDWNKEEQRWEIARTHFEPVVEALARRLGRIDVYVDFTCVERCDTRCWNAKSRDCNCQCMGRRHGAGGITHGWNIVGDATLVLVHGTRRRHFVVERPTEKEENGGR